MRKKNTHVHALRGKRVTVMGLGLHGGGLATTLWLLRQGARVLVTDSKTRQQLKKTVAQLPRSSGLKLVLGKHREQDFRSADMVVQNPGVPPTSSFLHIARAAGIPIVNEATLFFERCPGTIIAVTGTKGKSTTSTLIAQLLRAQFGKRVVLAGNIRTTAMLSVLDRLTSASLVVLELSSWQLELFAEHHLHPSVAVVTNLLEDHLDRHGTRAAYHRAKSWIWRWQYAQDVAILNWDDPASTKWRSKPKARTLWYSQKKLPAQLHGAYVAQGKFWIRRGKKTSAVTSASDVSLPGAHNLQNALAALLAAYVLGVPNTKLRKALRAFRGVDGRLSLVRTVHGVSYYNDTTATAPAATIRALQSFDRKPILIAGGVDKKLPYSALAKSITQYAKAVVFLPGSATEKLMKYLQKTTVPIFLEDSMHAAVHTAALYAQKGDIVVLSPAASSFNLFLHEFDRGDKFVREVKAL